MKRIILLLCVLTLVGILASCARASDKTQFVDLFLKWQFIETVIFLGQRLLTSALSAPAVHRAVVKARRIAEEYMDQN